MIIENIPNVEELVKLMKKHQHGLYPLWYIRVDHNPYGKGSPAWLWASFNDDDDEGDCINTYYPTQKTIWGIDYAWTEEWHIFYKGTFQLNTAPFQDIKPEVYEVGDTVEVLGVSNKCGDYEEWSKDNRRMIGKTFIIKDVIDDSNGVSYELDGWYFPHYAVRKVVDFAKLEPEPEKKTVTLELTDEQLEKIKKVLES